VAIRKQILGNLEKQGIQFQDVAAGHLSEFGFSAIICIKQLSTTFREWL